MRYLLDAHTFMWWDSDSSQLSSNVHDIISDRGNDIYLSVVSVWEITIKNQIGKLPLKGDLKQIVQSQVSANGFNILPISLTHTLKVGELALHHHDPFDRLLISQALVEEMTILSKDAIFKQYEAQVLW